MNNENIVLKLNLAKKQQGLTLKQLSEKSGISLGTVNKIMSGALLDIKADKLQKLCAALNIAAEDLLTDQAQPQSSPSESPRFWGLVKVACVSPSVRVGDCAYNAAQIVAEAKKECAAGAKIVVFPELCLTAYCCGDLFFQDVLRKAAITALQTVRDELATLPAVVIVGLPIVDNAGKLFNAAAVVFGGEVLGVVPKSNLPNYNEFYEKRAFTPANSFTTTIRLFDKDVPFGADILFCDELHPEIRFAVEICEDIWVSNSPSYRHAQAGANIVVNLSASDEVVGKAEHRRKMVEIQSAKACVGYVYCSSGVEESTSDTVFAGHNMICENGALLAESKPFTTGRAVAEVDVGFLSSERAKLSHNNEPTGYTTVNFRLPVCGRPSRVFDSMPFVPEDKKLLASRCELVLNMQAYSLKKRFEHVRAQKLVIGVSGGSDSTLALLVCKRCCELCGRDTSDIVAVTMPCFGTTERTLNNSVALASEMGTTVRKIDISAAVTQHLKDIGHDFAPDTTFENAQARERTQVLMDIANAVNGLVVGTGDMSEAALGWSTFNGDHMSMYCVNGSIPKTFVRALIAHEAQQLPKLRSVLLDVLATPISPELLPQQNGQIVQVTENIVGPYELHDYFLYMMIRRMCPPSKVFELAKSSFAGKFDEETIYKWLTKFVWRFFSQQFKRNCQPDCVKIGTVDIGKGDWRMPSDVCADSWIADLESVRPGKVTK